MILYVLGVIILLIVLFFIYIRLKYKFWSLQPVFHFYDIYYWFINIGIINKDLPKKNKYVNLKKIVTNPFEKVNELTKKQIVSLIQLYYFINNENNENKYEPKLENIIPYFIGHNVPTFWTYFLEPELFIDNKTSKTIQENQIIGVITSRPLHIKINGVRKDAEFDVYYIDYLCVNKFWRKKNIAPQLIQTHEYNQSYYNKRISVSLFKREEELTGIIPLTIYKTYCFQIRNKMFYSTQLNPKITLLTGDKQNIYYFYNFLKETTNKWDITIYPAISNIIELVTTNNLFVKMLVIDGNIVAIYIFRKTCTYIKKDKEIISCIASVLKENILTKDEYLTGFYVSLLSILKDNKQFKYLTIEDISDNRMIIKNIETNISPLVVSPMAYYFYNFAYNPFKSEKCFIIN
jgi:hypothetical protein